MEKILYTSKMPPVTVTLLPDGKRDVTVLVNEEEIVEPLSMPILEEPAPIQEQPADVLEEVTDIQGEPEAPEEIEQPEPEVPEPETPVGSILYQYDGNQFRTVYELTEEDVLADLDKYLNYDSAAEPTLEQLSHDHELIDSFTLELMEGGLL